MPTYDYRCQSCSHEFEQFQSMSAQPLKKCPSCGKMKLKRLIGAGAGIIFKGSGFYETDYRSESYKKAAKAEQQGSSDGGSGKSASDDGKGKSDASDSSASKSSESGSASKSAAGGKSDA